MSITAALVTVMVVGLAWATSIRGVLHGLLITLATVAFLPFVLLLGLLALLIVGGVLAALAGEDASWFSTADGGAAAEGLVSIPKKWLVPYYRFLFRERRPVVLGIVAGVVLGTVTIWVLLSTLIVPKEVRTLQCLASARQAIEHAYEAEGHYPSPAEGKWLSPNVLAAFGQGANGCVGAENGARWVLDGFGRPILYEVEGRSRLASYRLRSPGFDGAVGRDDLCVAGATRMRTIMSRVAGALDSLDVLAGSRGADASWRQSWSALRAASCDDTPEE